MRVLESWLCFQKGRYKEAVKILTETEAVLRSTDDFVVLGNIQSTYGRIYRQEGRYDRAVQHFTAAIEEYRKVDRQHPHLVRTLANMAYVKRAVAVDFQRKLDAELVRRKPGVARGAEAASSQAHYRDQVERVRNEAFAELDEAAVICGVHPNHRGTGTVHLNRGLLHLDSGSLDLAEDQSARAFALGEEKQDHILMARARLLQSIVENAKVEEGIEGDPRRHAQAALDYIRDAIELARSTQNRRLLARVHTWHGLILSNEYFNDLEAATHAMNTASSFLDHGYHDTAWEDLRTLKGRVVKSQSVNDKLRAWSHGDVGSRTFQQLEEEFAEIIIPKVWEREERKISRVATKLSISPKKVRRALSRAGLLRGKAGAATTD
jgi:tetratricopeptide (TPR) repeat protein